MISIKQVSNQPTRQPGVKQHVGFAMDEQLVEDSRQMNSRREFQIRKNSNSKQRMRNKGNKSPSDFTNVGAKSVVSMFTSHSGKTTFSAPAFNGNEDSVSVDHQEGSYSPSNRYKNQDLLRRALHGKKGQKVLKSKIRPASSISPSKPLMKQERNDAIANYNTTNANQSLILAQSSMPNGIRSFSQEILKEGGVSNNSGKTFSMKAIKIQKKSKLPGPTLSGSLGPP